MRRRSFLGLLFVFTLVSLLLLPLQRQTVAAPSPPLAQQLVPLQQAVDVHSSSILQPDSTTAVLPFYPSDDATVQEGAPSSTDPSNHYLGTGYNQSSFIPFWADGRVRSYMWFDLPSLPAGSTVMSATLRLYHAGGVDYSDQTANVTFYRVTENWNEATVTWNSRPGYAESLGSVSTTYDFEGWVTLDLTAQVLAWVRGTQNNYGLVAIGPEGTPGVCRLFASGETDHSPELHVRYLPPPVLDVWPGTLSARASSTQPPPALSLQVSNVTNDSLEWSASKVGGATWLALSKSSGSATPTTPDSLSLTVDASGLTPGTYTEQIRISSSTPNVKGSPLTVTFALEVVDHLSEIYLPLIAGGGGGSASPPKVVALIIGIGDYQYLGPAHGLANLPDDWGTDLPNPPRDVDDFHDLLLAEFGVSPAHILRYGGGPDEASTMAFGENSIQAYPLATRANVVAGFGQLESMEDEQTIVVFYYSGHGGQTPDNNGDESDGYDEFIAMYDTMTDPVGFVNVLTDDDLAGLLANLESEHIGVILDSCFSGSMMETTMHASSDLLRRGLMRPTESDVNSVQSDQAALAELVGPDRVVITASTGDQGTWESNVLENGVFTHFFLQGLRDSLHDVNQNSRISAEEAYWFSRDVVDAWVYSNLTSHQNPDIDDQHFGQVDLTWLR
jgi:hypothetical protein